MTEVDFEIKLKALAIAFFNDCKNDKDYPFSTWEEQAMELRQDLNESQINAMFELDPEGYLDLANGSLN